MKADLETDIRAASAAGFDCLEIWASKLKRYLKSHSASDLRRLFDEHNVEPYSINSIEHITFRDAAAHAQILTECEELCRVAEQINCPYVVVVPGKIKKSELRTQDSEGEVQRSGAGSRTTEEAVRAEVIEESVQVLSELGRIADRNGVGLAFEFLGQTDCSVQTLEVADEIVRQVARKNIGLVIDSFHFYAGGSKIESIESLDPERLFIFHINDAEDRPREELEDKHRLLPGLGILPLKEIVGALNRIGYDRVTSVEIFRPEYWELDPFQLALDARKAVAQVIDGVRT
jgi:2-keto-myo-inositol isomerase